MIMSEALVTFFPAKAISALNAQRSKSSTAERRTPPCSRRHVINRRSSSPKGVSLLVMRWMHAFMCNTGNQCVSCGEARPSPLSLSKRAVPRTYSTGIASFVENFPDSMEVTRQRRHNSPKTDVASESPPQRHRYNPSPEQTVEQANTIKTKSHLACRADETSRRRTVKRTTRHQHQGASYAPGVATNETTSVWQKRRKVSSHPTACPKHPTTLL